MSAQKLRTLSNRLFTCMQMLFWTRPQWIAFKNYVDMLARSLAGYIEYLTQKCKEMKLVHASPKPVREVGDGLQLSVLPLCVGCLSQFAPLEQALLSQEMYEPLSLLELPPRNHGENGIFYRPWNQGDYPFLVHCCLIPMGIMFTVCILCGR